MKARKELKEFRTPNSKRFLNKDGTIQVELYKEPIHYKSDNGQYEEIDNTFEETTTGVKNKKNDFIVEFDEKNENCLLNISSKGHKLCMYPKKVKGKKRDKYGIKNNKNKQVDRVKYEGILDNIDIEYELHSKCLKESIILHEKPKNNIVEFILKTDLELNVNTDNSIYISNGKEKLFKLQKPFMIDNKKSYSESIKYEIEKNKNEYEIRMVLDNEWINSKEREYPIIIDPTITGIEDVDSVIDTYIFRGDENTTTYNQNKLLVGIDENNVSYRTLLKFNLPVIPPGYKMVNSELVLKSCTENYENNSENIKIAIHKINTNWEGMTAKWNSLSQAYDEKLYDYTLLGNINYDIDEDNEKLGIVANVTELVQEWYSSPNTNNGIIIKLFNESSEINNLFEFYSSEYSTDEIEKPLIRVTYKNFNGLEEYLSYSSHNHHYGVSHISNYTGNLTTIFNIGNTTGESSSITASLVYNSNDVIDGKNYGYGLGMKPNFLQFIKKIIIENEEFLEFTDEDGTVHYFSKNDDYDSYSDEDGLNLTISYATDYYMMTDTEGTIYKFVNYNDVYYLDEIKYSNEKKIDINYNEEHKISSIIDTANQEINFIYLENLIMVSSPHFTTSLVLANNYVTSITALEDTETLIYYSNGLLKKIINPNNSAVEYEYISGSSAKVCKVTEVGKNGTIGNYLTFEYNLYDTKVIDNDGKFNTYIFNSFGNIIGITSINDENNFKESYGKSYSFGEENENKNQLTADKSLVQYVDNLIDDSSFEAGSSLDFLSNDISCSYCVENHNPRSGNNALEISIPTILNYIYKEFSVEKGKAYTFSLYIRNSKQTPLSLALKMGYDDVESVTYINDVNNEYKRFSVTIDYALSANSNLKVYIQNLMDEESSFSIDDIQLEVGNVANYYNLVSNSSFKNDFSTWEYEITGENDVTVSIVDINTNNEKALKLHSSPRGTIYITKKFNISGKEGDVFNLSFWFKNEGIIPSGFSGGIDGECIMTSVFFYYDDEYLDGTCVPYKNLTPSSNWQFFSENFIAESDYNNLEIRILSIENANDCYLTNFSLFKDLERYSYQYNDNGQLVLTTDLNSEQTQLYYDNNQLVESKNPLGTNFKFEYDIDLNDRMIRTTSSSGISNYLKYDSNGNNISNIMRNRKIGFEIEEDVQYFIRGRGTNKYFYVNYDKTLKIKENECSYDKFYIVKEGNDKIKLRHAVLSNYYIQNIDGEIKLVYGDNNNVFYLEKHENDSYSLIKNVTIFDEEDNEIIEQHAITIDENLQLTINLYEENDLYQQFYFENCEDKLFIETTLEYSEDGRFCTKNIDELGNKEEYVINNINGLTESIIDNNGNIQSYLYDNKMRVTSITKGNMSVNIEYADDNICRITHGTKNYNFVYDEFDKISAININDINLVNNHYKANNGELEKVKYGNNQEIAYSYDNNNRLRTITKNDDVYNYYYDNLNRVSKILSEKVKCEYIYDFAKRLNNYKFNSYEAYYTYDKESKIIQKEQLLDSKKYTSNYVYNNELAITKYNLEDVDYNYKYDNLGRLTETNINDNYIIKYNYLTQGNKTSSLVNKIDDNGIIYIFKFDKLGNIIEINRDNNIVYRYNYDDHSQLIKEEDLVNNETTTYSYDNYGNILSRKIYENGTDTLLNEVTYEYGNSNWQDQLTKFNENVITYDSIGNITSIGNKNFSWKNGKELGTYTSLENNAIYFYNEDGIRISKNVNGKEIKYFIEDNRVIFEDNNGNLIYYIYNNDELLGFKYNENMYLYHKNIFGDIIGIFNNNYEEIVSYEYDSWGQLIKVVDTSGINLSSINPFRYRSYYYDNESNLYYVEQRYYNPEIGRWISPEPSVYRATFDDNNNILCYNVYTYCGNNPIMYKDEDGESITLTCIIVGACIGLVVGSVYGSSRAKKNGYSPKDGWKYWKYIVQYGVIGATVGALIGYGASFIISKFGVATAAKSITKGGGARFNNFSALKKSLGSCGKGNEWHHIVEQSQIKKSGFSKYWIQNSNNVISIPKSIHSKVTGHYNGTFYVDGVKVRIRDWLSGQSFEKQYEYGIKILRRFGVKI